MKYLSNYLEDAQTKCFDKHGVFFAFSNKQFDEQKKEGIKYASLGAGLIVPKDNVKAFIVDHKAVVTEAIKQDTEENGKEAIINRELGNHECFYTGDPESCIDALEDYDITQQEIMEVFSKGEML